MFQKIAFTGLLCSLLTLPLMAQQAPATDAQANDRPQRFQNADPATRARRQTDRMAKALDLDQATTQKVYDAELARVQKAEEIMKGSDDGDTRKKAQKENNDAFQAKLQTLLTPDQLKKLDDMQAQMKDRMRNRQGGSNDNN